MRRSAVVLVALLVGAATACGDPGVEPPLTALPRALSADEQSLVAADNAFAFRLLRETLQRDDAPNIVVSPLSVAMALGMTVNGAAGTTRAALLASLGLDHLDRDAANAAWRDLIGLLATLDGAVTWELANSVWVRQGWTLAPSFTDRVATYFGAEARTLDFDAATAAPTINDWVRNRTRDRIPQIVPDPIPPAVIAYLVNAIYFKAPWRERFDPARTTDGPFALRSGQTVTVPMMYRRETSQRATETPDVLVAELPYARGAWVMTIAMPQRSADVDALAGALTQAQWSSWVDQLDSVRMDVTMPRFTTRWGGSLVEQLQALGAAEAFCDAGIADFQDLVAGVQPGELCITDVQHRTFVQVNEEGTEAAAATSVGVGVTSAPPAIRIDRPFIFAIRERLSGTIVFLGVVRDPR